MVYTHGIAGFFGGLLVGLFADPKMIEYLGLGSASSVLAAQALFYGHPHQLLVQFEAALTIIIWDAVVTFLIFMVIKYVFRVKLRLTDDGARDRRRGGARRGGVPVRRAGRRGRLSMADEASPGCPRGRRRPVRRRVACATCGRSATRARPGTELKSRCPGAYPDHALVLQPRLTQSRLNRAAAWIDTVPGAGIAGTDRRVAAVKRGSGEV